MEPSELYKIPFLSAQLCHPFLMEELDFPLYYFGFMNNSKYIGCGKTINP
jgi:hypothetical protein